MESVGGAVRREKPVDVRGRVGWYTTLGMRPLVAFLLLSLPACSSPAPERAPEVAPAPAAPPGTSAAMVGHFQETLRIKRAVIDGELGDVRAAAKDLADSLVARDFPEAWRPYLRTTAHLASAAVAAPDMPGAAAAAAGLASACGECHAAVGGGPAFPAPGAPPAVTPRDNRSQMARHQWAADRMWEALVSRSDAAWRAGAAALVDAPLNCADITRDVELPEEVLQLGTRVHALAREAEAVEAWPQRSALYGEFLASCAGCHKGGC